MYSEQLEQLIKSVIADGVITEKERAVLHKKAAAEGIDEDEIDVYVDGLLTQKKAESPQKASIDFKYVSKSRHDKYVVYQGQRPYLVISHGGPIKKLYLNFFKMINDKENKTEWGIFIFPIIKSGLDYHRRLQLKTDTTSLELPRRGAWFNYEVVPEILKQKYKDLTWKNVTLHYIDEEMLKILCDSNNITVSILDCEVSEKKYVDIKDISVNDFATYAQVFYRSVVDNSAYPDAVINENESSEALKRKKDVYDVDDVDDDMAIRLLTEDTDKWEKIKPRPGIIDQYKGLKGITITDIHFGAYFNDEDHLELKALSDKKGDFRFFFVYEGGWWKLKKDLKLVVNMEDHQVRYLQNNDDKYAYEVDASVLQEMFTTKHNVSLEDRYLNSVPQGRWKEAFEYLTDSNKMKEWIEKYEENEESGFFGKLKNFFGS